MKFVDKLNISLRGASSCAMLFTCRDRRVSVDEVCCGSGTV